MIASGCSRRAASQQAYNDGGPLAGRSTARSTGAKLEAYFPGSGARRRLAELRRRRQRLPAADREASTSTGRPSSRSPRLPPRCRGRGRRSTGRRSRRATTGAPSSGATCCSASRLLDRRDTLVSACSPSTRAASRPSRPVPLDDRRRGRGRRAASRTPRRCARRTRPRPPDRRGGGAASPAARARATRRAAARRPRRRRRRAGAGRGRARRGTPRATRARAAIARSTSSAMHVAGALPDRDAAGCSR